MSEDGGKWTFTHSRTRSVHWILSHYVFNALLAMNLINVHYGHYNDNGRESWEGLEAGGCFSTRLCAGKRVLCFNA